MLQSILCCEKTIVNDKIGVSVSKHDRQDTITIMKCFVTYLQESLLSVNG